MDLGLAGKVALVTGGSTGIGRAVAQRLALEGVRVCICARRPDVLDRAAAEIRAESGMDVLPIAGDVANAEDAHRFVEETASRLGRLDVLVNNAGKSAAGPFATVDDEGWQADLDLKLFGAIRTIRAAVPIMSSRGGGAIINIVNIGAKAPGAASVPTSVSRAAGIALTKALSKELGPSLIRVNAICIGQIRSDQWVRRASSLGEDLDHYYDRVARESRIPLGRVGDAEEVADLIAFLVSERGRYVTGTAINMDGGSSAVV